MKIVLLLSNHYNTQLNQYKNLVVKVLKELEIESQVIHLDSLPHYQEEKDSSVAAIANSIAESTGVIAIATVHISGMHSTMQNFFEHIMEYEEVVANKPLFALTYSKYLGEKQAASKMLETWSALGGADGGNLALSSRTEDSEAEKNLEKSIEDFYRLLRQERNVLVSSERQLYLLLKQDAPIERQIKRVTPLSEVVKEEMPKKEATINLSTKEQNIMELTQLLKSQIGSNNKEEFIAPEPFTYKKPTQQTSPIKKLHHIPHYFVGQHDKDMTAVIQYILNDTGEKGVITIRDGDCQYREGIEDTPTVELALSASVLNEILTNQITYQKAFMIGKLKVRGNFIILSKLDQVFKGL